LQISSQKQPLSRCSFSLVALPGWFVVDPKPEQIPVMGPNYLKGYLRRQLNSVISPAQVERIVAFLEILIGRWVFDYRAVPRIMSSDDSRPVRSRLRIGPIE
jgi:hypothetical protein